MIIEYWLVILRINSKLLLNNDNSYSDDNLMCASVLFDSMLNDFNVTTHDIWEGNVTTRRHI